MRSKEFIPEARRNPELNPRHHTIDVLEKLYKQVKDSGDYISEDMPNLFAHFSDVEKLGITPTWYYQNPVGVYGHPVKTILEDGNVRNFYAGTKSLVNVFQISGNVLNLETIDPDQQNKLFDQAWEMVINSKKFNNLIRPSTLKFSDPMSWWETMQRVASLYFAKIWNCKDTVAINKLFRTLEFTAILDPGMYLITSDIIAQLIVFDVRTIKNNRTFPNLYKKTNISDQNSKQLLQHTQQQLLQIHQLAKPKLKELVDQNKSAGKWIEFVDYTLQDPKLSNQLIDSISSNENSQNLKYTGVFIQELLRYVKSILNMSQLDPKLINQILEIINQAYVIAKQELYKNY